MAWSGLGKTHLVRKQAIVQESLGLVSGRTQPAHYWFPTFRLGCILLQTTQIQFGSGWLCKVLAKQTQSGSKPVCKNHLAHFWPTLLSQSGLDANWIWHVYWVNSIKVTISTQRMLPSGILTLRDRSTGHTCVSYDNILQSYFEHVDQIRHVVKSGTQVIFTQ